MCGNKRLCHLPWIWGREGRAQKLGNRKCIRSLLYHLTFVLGESTMGAKPAFYIRAPHPRSVLHRTFREPKCSVRSFAAIFKKKSQSKKKTVNICEQKKEGMMTFFLSVTGLRWGWQMLKNFSNKKGRVSGMLMASLCITFLWCGQSGCATGRSFIHRSPFEYHNEAFVVIATQR